jgi:hypothetical protein
MKRATLYSTMILAIALCPILAQAQALLKANIPFEFTAGSRTMSSGVYYIENAGNHMQLLRNPETNATAFVASFSVGNPNKIDLTKNVLVFRRYGPGYVLTQIWASGEGHEVPVSKRLRELAKSEKPSETIVAMEVGK